MNDLDDILIRAEEPADFAAIGEVNRLAFGGEGEAALVAKLREWPGFIPELSLVAVKGGKIVGHILISPVKIAPEGNDACPIPALSLAPMSVLPELQNQGIGSALVRRGLDEARRLRHKVVVVVGHPHYYPRFGFEPARPRGLEAPFPVPDEAFLVLELMPGVLQGVRGTVVYPPAFDEVS
jgi:putative acetyltransferase